MIEPRVSSADPHCQETVVVGTDRTSGPVSVKKAPENRDKSNLGDIGVGYLSSEASM